MKSSSEDLSKRGFITKEDIKKFVTHTDNELMEMINSSSSVSRSAAVHILSQRFTNENLDFTHTILERLTIEKCLYTKIEICTALEKGSIKTAKSMVSYLGLIGHNQHKKLPERISKKKSYPLPRDIIARSLGRMNVDILPVLLNILNSNNEIQIAEAIDAVGFMLFYNPESADKKSFEIIISTIQHYSDNEVILWKCIRCLSAFKTKDCILYLNNLLNNCNNKIIKCEVNRSLTLIGGI